MINLIRKLVAKNKSERIIVSLASFPARIETVHIVIESLLKQTKPADRIILNLAADEVKYEDIPQSLQNLCNDKFEIKLRDVNLKPHNKYYYTYKEYPNDLIITVDDDIHYPPQMINELYEAHLKFPSEIICRRGHTIPLSDVNKKITYNDLFLEPKIINKPSHAVLATGVGGILYPPNCLHESFSDTEAIKKLALLTDDLWLKWMELKNDRKVVQLEEDTALEYIDGTQEVGLWTTVNSNGNNDISWDGIIKNDVHAKELLQKICIDYLNLTKA